MAPHQEYGLLYITWISYLASKLIQAQPLLSSISLFFAIGASASVILFNGYKLVKIVKSWRK